MPERISLEGKVAVVTGAGRGMGRAYVELLAERGARVVVNDLGTDVSGFGKDSAVAEQVADLIRSRGGEAIGNDSDVSTPEGGRDLIATTIEHFGRVDLLVNNAGICGSQLFEDATLDDFDHYWRVHLGGPVNTVKAAWPYMVAQHYGKIILTTSVAGLLGIRGQATYAAAKCAVVGLMRILAIEGAEHGILVNTISPAAYTRMHPAAGSRVAEADGKATTPVEAVAPAIVWLASDGCSETNRIYNVEGVGVTWYTWLEQGRPINASSQVLDAVARTLQLDSAERWHLYRLAEALPLRAAATVTAAVVPDAVHDVLRSLDPLPAVLMNS